MEKAWRVKMLVWNKNTSTKEAAEIHEFVVLEHTEENAKLRALIETVKLFPLDEGYVYDNDNASVKEISRTEMRELLEQRQAENVEQGNQRIEAALTELKNKTGIDLRNPK